MASQAIGRSALRLCDPGGPVLLLFEGLLAKLRKKLVEAIKWDRLRRRDLDVQWSARRGVIDDDPILSGRRWCAEHSRSTRPGRFTKEQLLKQVRTWGLTNGRGSIVAAETSVE